jgi:hypothetical protein
VSRRSAAEIAFLVGAPAALGLLELFHPHPHDLFQLDLTRWLTVHYVQLALFPLAALALVTTIRGQRGSAAVICRLAMLVFAICYTAFDTAAGIVTGVLVQAGEASGTPEAWREPVMTIWNHPILGGGPGSPPVLAVAGTLAWLVGALAAALVVRRSGAPWPAVALFAASAFGLLVFRTHAWPGGPITFLSQAAGTAWLVMTQSHGPDVTGTESS